MKHSVYAALQYEWRAEGSFDPIVLPPRPKRESPLWQYPVLPLGAHKIERQYVAAISRHSSYHCCLANHVKMAEFFGVTCYCRDHRNVMVGHLQMVANHKVFIASHFAPQTMRGGMKLLQQMQEDELPIVFAVTSYLANMLSKMGYEEVGRWPQIFDGQLVMKTIMVNEAALRIENDLTSVLEDYM